MKTEKQQAAAAEAFAARWAGRGYERGDSQIFWADLLTNVYGVENIADFIRYEEQVKVDSTNFIDGHIPTTRVLIEQKSLGKDLRKGIPQSDGSILNPFQQAKRYVANMPLSEHPRWIVTCNFAEFLVYDMEQPNGEPEQILLANLGREYHRLQFLVDSRSEHLSREMQVSMQAGEIVGRIYEALLEQYMAPLGGDVSHVASGVHSAGETPALLSNDRQADSYTEALRWLNILCVRIVFCLYAEDAGVFRHDQFHDYLAHYDASDLRNALIRLFEVLNTPPEKRSRYLKEDLKAFPYTNGGLFEEVIEIPQFTEELQQTLLQNASLDFDWSEISPTIFGAVFESTLNPETRRTGGMHYTSIENIHKVIDPLFLNDLRRELDEILGGDVSHVANGAHSAGETPALQRSGRHVASYNQRRRNQRLDEFQERLSRLTFLDPACGSGNFLTETYLSLRRLENEAIRERYHGQTMMGAFVNPIKVSIGQFYGIEINDFAVTVATTALWISEAQMLAETERIIHQNIDFLPLKSYSNIREGNALRMDWLGGDVSHVVSSAQAEGNAYGYMAGETPALLSNASLQYMERDQFIHITGGKLPHWHQDNKVQFVTFRLADSLPQERLEELSACKEQWLAEHPKPWSEQTEEEYNHYIRTKIDRWLDNNYGSCLLQHQNIRQIVTDSLLYNHGKSYWLHHFVVMPNHVHLLLTPIGGNTAEEAVGNVKKFTAHAINNALGRQGVVWQRSVFDRMVRSQQNYDKYVAYINSNPACLPKGTYTLGGDVSHVANGAQVAGETPALQATTYDYIIGNPPFVGHQWRTESQAADMDYVFADTKKHGKLDYVAAWYKKAADMMQGTKAKAAFVSTNSISQGESVAALWDYLFKQRGVEIQFAHRTFKWTSEATQKAAVHCVIIGFTCYKTGGQKLLFDGDKYSFVEHINGYLLAAPDLFIQSRGKPLIPGMPIMSKGSQPTDGGNLILSAAEREELLKAHPEAAPLIRRYLGSDEFINNRLRYCLWLKGIAPSAYRNIPPIMQRLQHVADMRRKSPTASVRRDADTPMLFTQIRQPEERYLAIPKVSSERRRYIPIGYMTPDIVSNDMIGIIPNASLYMFGVLTSNVHMAWMRVVAGRLKSDYRYTPAVYNNFPWPLGGDVSHVAISTQPSGETNDHQAGETPALLSRRHLRERIEQTAQAILDARALYPDSSLADLYDELTMPPELRRAHQDNDCAVMQAYGFPVKSTFTESQCVAELFKLYQHLL